jgi:hypothetical protein
MSHWNREQGGWSYLFSCIKFRLGAKMLSFFKFEIGKGVVYFEKLQGANAA